MNTTWFSLSALKEKVKVTRDFSGASPIFISSFSKILKFIKHITDILFISSGQQQLCWVNALHNFTAQCSTWALRVKAFGDFRESNFFAQSGVFAHRHWVASRPWQELWCSHHLQAQCDLLFTTDIHLSVTDVGKQQWARERRMGTCQHAEHCTLFWHSRNACFPTQALDSKRVLTTLLLDDNREVYVILRLCNQKISRPQTNTT